MSENKIKGYVGRILRIDLTNETTSDIDTFKYAPKYIGGQGIATRIFYEDVGPGVGAFDAENELIFMTGPACGTGTPASGRATFVSIAPNAIPEQMNWSGIGGYFGEALKHAGYDGFVMVGKAKEHTYIVIDDGKVSFKNADDDGLWGQFTQETQELIFDKYGRDYYSIVIGPAGENLMRNASISTSADNAAAKSGYGAVMGSKNIKAVVAHGNMDITVGNIEQMLHLRKTVNAGEKGDAAPGLNPINMRDTFGANQATSEDADSDFCEVEGGWRCGWLACCPGCTMRCNMLTMDTKDPFTGKTMHQLDKCVDVMAPVYKADCFHQLYTYTGSEVNHPTIAETFIPGWQMDPNDPEFDTLNIADGGDILNYWDFNFEHGNEIMYLCNAYGIDKWDVLIWYMTWFSACKKEGLLDEIKHKFDIEPDVENPEFMRYFMDMITYRKGEMGQLFGEGMGRAIRKLGKEKFGDSIYHGRYNSHTGQKLDIPVSLEEAWGSSMHWLGRGFQGINFAQWVMNALELMVSNRDAQSNAHQKTPIVDWKQFKDDPCHSPLMAHDTFINDCYGPIKESILGCDWTGHNPYRPNVEVDTFNAATGLELTEQELFEAGVRIKLLFRAVMMRNHGRTRDMEVEEVFPTLTYPDPAGITLTWDDWNDAVDLYYAEFGWDKATGWPTEETWKMYGLEDIAEDMRKLGLLPDESAPYVRKANPFDGHKRVK